MKGENAIMGEFPRILVVSHTVFSCTGNMGKTMMDMLQCVPPKNLAQLYFHSEVPTQVNCERYFRITDKDILQSVYTRKPRFWIFKKENIEIGRKDSRTDTGISTKIYQFSRRRTPLIYFLRNMLWSFGKWMSPELDSWIKNFAPDLIFFAAGDYAFAYKIVCKLSDRYDLPIVMWCSDDYYIGRKKTISPLYHYVCQNRLKWAQRTVARSTHMIAISDKMRSDYSDLFQIPVTTMHISARENCSKLPISRREGIVYSGNLGVNRVQPLIEIGRALKKAGIPGYEYIDVYSGDKNQKNLEQMTQDNGICFHGSVGKEQLEEVLGSTKFVLHVEAFDEESRVRTRYSLSTKIGEYLQSGACILAYGPRDIASVEYLAENDAAVVLNGADEAPDKLREVLDNLERYEELKRRAVKLAEKSHNKQENDKTIISIFAQAKRNGRTTNG